MAAIASEARPDILLGIDTGGTYTDAVLIDAARQDRGAEAVIAKAKALTTPADLSIGIAEALAAVLAEADLDPGRIGLVALSTTLATNALVEGRGGRVALVMIGFEAADIARQGLGPALGTEPLIRIAGGHDALGAEQAPLDLAGLRTALAETDRVAGFAVCGHFAVRNRAHEIAARDAIRALTDAPVTCSHELTAEIGGPRRALTALLNARLIGLIDRLIRAGEARLAERGIAAPLMVVRGDGSLVAAAEARARPIETILSGPAASLVGAAWLTGLDAAIAADIGGTTTDIAVLSGGRPRLDPAGARVGGHRTMVEAVAVETHGLGGDSEIGLETGAPGPALRLGPRRAVPVALVALAAPERVHEALDRQRGTRQPGELDGRFLLAGEAGAEARDATEAEILAALAAGPQPADRVLRRRGDLSAANRLIARGAAMTGAFTPSDAAHLLGLQEGWDRAAAEKAAALFARTRGRDGAAVAPDAAALARAVRDLVIRRSAETVLEAALAEDGFAAPGLARHPLAAAALDGHAGLARPRIGLTVALIGLGAAAPAYYPQVAALIGAESRVPAHADVANAIGAVVGLVRLTRRATISVPSEGRFRAHLPEGPADFADRDRAEAALLDALGAGLRREAEAAGTERVELVHRIDRRTVTLGAEEVTVAVDVAVTASGRPRRAAPGRAARQSD